MRFSNFSQSALFVLNLVCMFLMPIFCGRRKLNVTRLWSLVVLSGCTFQDEMCLWALLEARVMSMFV